MRSDSPARRGSLTIVALIASILVFLPRSLLAAEGKGYRLGEASFEVPAEWSLVRKTRESSLEFRSLDKRYDLRIEWWLPDEPILGYDDIVFHKKMTVAGEQATYVYSRFPASQSLQVVIDKPRADKRQLLIVLESATEDFRNGSAVLDDVLSRLVLGAERGDAPADGHLRRPRDTASPAAPAPVLGSGTAVDGGAFALDLPPGWKRNSAERDGLRLLTLVAPDKRALVLVAEAQAVDGRSAEAIIGEFEELYYQDYALPDGIERDDDLYLGGVAGHYVEMLATLHSIEGVRLPFSRGRSWLFKGVSGARGFVVAVVTDADAPAQLMKQARGVAASFRLERAVPDVMVDDAAAGFDPASGISVDAGAGAGQPPIATDYDNDEEVLTDADIAALKRHFGGDCHALDLADWRSDARSALEERQAAHLQWVMRCRNDGLLVLGAVFDYDPQGQTEDFFRPLYLAVLRANADEPYAIVDKPDNLIVNVKPTPDGGIDLDFADFAPAPGAGAGAAAPATNTGMAPVAERTLFAGQLDERWTKWAGSGGDFDSFAREDGRQLAIDVPAGNGWGKTGIRSIEPVVQLPSRTDKQSTRLDFSIDPARSDNFIIDLVPAGRGGDEEWNAHQLRFGIGHEAGAKPVLKLWVEREEVSKHELAAVPATLTLELRPDGEAIVSDETGAPLVDGIIPEAIDPQGYHVYAIAHAPAAGAPAALALQAIKLTMADFTAADDEPRYLGPKEAQRQVLFDGRLMGRGWRRYSAQGGDFAAHARFEDGALFVDVPAGASWGKAGLYSEEPLVWFDGTGEGAMAGLTFSFDPARTTGFVVALASISSLNGNDPSNPKFLLHWRRTGDNSAKVAILRDYDRVKEIDLDSGAAPEHLALLLTRGRVAVAAPDWGLAPFAFPDVQPGAGFRVYAYSHPDKADEPVKMALKRIELERNADEPPAAVSPDVAPLPLTTLFDGEAGDGWEPSSVDNADFATSGRFETGAVVVDVPEKRGQWAKGGLVSRGPVLRLDERAQSTAYRLTFEFDPRRTTGTQIIFNADKRDNLWDGRRVSVALIRHTEGRYKDQYVLEVESDGYRRWSRAIDAAWMEQSWNGTLEVEAGERWLVARIPGASEVRGSDLRLYKGDELYMVVSSHPAMAFAGSRMALRSIAGQWVLPETASALDRWSYVDDNRFDSAGFLDELASDAFGAEAPRKETGDVAQ
jgi:hypothetical protein